MQALQGKRFEALDSFRGICALLVVCYHARILLSVAELPFFRHANYFVEFFFVLSGFVMYHTYGAKTMDSNRFKDYLTSRFFRIYPMHILVLTVVIGLEFMKLLGQQKGFYFNNAAFTASADPKYILPNILLIQAWVSESAALSFNVPSWSISIEFYLYIIFGVLMWKAGKMKNIFFVAIVLVAGTLIMINQLPLTDQAMRGLLCFFAGCLSYMAYKKIAFINSNKLLFTILELVLALLIIYTIVADFSGVYKGIVTTLLFCVTIITFAVEGGAISALLRNKVFTYLGKLSYSIYITHYIIYFLFLATAIVLSKVIGHDLTIVDNSGAVATRFITTHHVIYDQLILLALLLVVIVISGFTYKYVELKGIELGKRFKKKRAAAVA
ncbi:acyltransferase family protein [Chitinophaga pinensis]|uniref:Acyltransferase 3 n=1 Tax=Chitinophaga pinensis (strain ATCC 43595 / DSM 2588 / LMG 13176 / NBRC 15968 / NCIMB 11800 / UQM 2034) TaxID=485918 RepID=A0A979GBZ8_CHIPD|nr:acyltransferase [Chitinophaga pinensis]ACU64512.1 acyltransferase 3 [Chitinophaga pinensis DSM 2588]